MDKADYYSILGLKRLATTSEIKARYKSLAKRYHPDHHGGDTNVMSYINHAYSVLSDPKSRFEYNRLLDKRLSRTFKSRSTKVKQPSWQRTSAAQPIKRRTLFNLLFDPIGIVAVLIIALVVVSLLPNSQPVTLNSAGSGNSPTGSPNNPFTLTPTTQPASAEPTQSSNASNAPSSQPPSPTQIERNSSITQQCPYQSQEAYYEAQISSLKKQINHLDRIGIGGPELAKQLSNDQIALSDLKQNINC